MQKILAFVKALTPLRQILLIVGVLFVLIFVAPGLLCGTIPGIISNVFNNTFNPPARTEITNTESIVERIQSHGTLLNIKESFSGRFGASLRYGAVCNVGAEYQMYGSVQAGIDLLLLNADDVTFDPATESLVFTLPAAYLADCTVDAVRSLRTSTWGVTPLCPMDEDEMRRLNNYSAINAFRDRSLSGGILDKAEDGSIDDFTTLINELFPEYADLTVTVRFKERETPILDDSCTPEVPGGVVIDPQTGAWSRR